MAWRPHGRARVNVNALSSWATCDRCGIQYNISDLQWQMQWRGSQMLNTRILVCKLTCLDIPQAQLKTLILPPDPSPTLNARPEPYLQDESPCNRITLGGGVRVTMNYPAPPIRVTNGVIQSNAVVSP